MKEIYNQDLEADNFFSTICLQYNEAMTIKYCGDDQCLATNVSYVQCNAGLITASSSCEYDVVNPVIKQIFS